MPQSISSLFNENLLEVSIAVIIGGVLLTLAAKAFGGGLLTAWQVLTGRWSTDAVTGTLASIGRIQHDNPRFLYRDLRFTSDQTGRNINFSRMRVGKIMHASGVLAAGKRGGWLLTAGRKSGESIKRAGLLGYTDGDYIYHSASDLADLYRFSNTYALMAGIVGLIAGFFILMLNVLMLPLPAPVQQWAGLITIAGGLLPLVLFLLIYKRALKKLTAATEEALSLLALEVRAAADAPQRKKPIAPPPTSYSGDLGGLLSVIGFFTPLSFLLAPLVWLLKLVYTLSAVWAAPRFELRRLQIGGCGQPTRDYHGGRVVYETVTLKNAASGMEQKAEWVLVAETLANNGLVAAGASGLWLVPESGAGRQSVDWPPGRLILVGFYDEESGLIYNQTDILQLYRYNVLTPWLAALTGLAIGAALLILRTGTIFIWPEGLWLLPAALLPYLMLIAAKKRIISAAEEVFRRELPAGFPPPSGRV